MVFSACTVTVKTSNDILPSFTILKLLLLFHKQTSVELKSLSLLTVASLGYLLSLVLHVSPNVACQLFP